MQKSLHPCCGTLSATVLVAGYLTFVFGSGLLGGHSAAIELQKTRGRMKWYNNTLLHLAKELGDKLLPAFNTSSGMPMSRVSFILNCNPLARQCKCYKNLFLVMLRIKVSEL